MNAGALLQNKVLIAGLIAWAMAQVIKIPLDYLRTRRWNWALIVDNRRHAKFTFGVDDLHHAGHWFVLRL